MKEGWVTGKFSNIFDLQMGKTPSRDNSSYWGGTNAWVSIADLNCGKYIYDTKECITDSAVAESGIHLVYKDTVIMSFKLSIGKTAIAAKDLYTNEAIMSFHPKDGFEILPDYIYYYLKGYNWQGMNIAVMGVTLNKKAISNNFFSFPQISEQQHIVEELDLLSSIIEKKKAQLNELDNLAQSLFYEMFGDPITNEKGWEVKPLRENVVEMFLGPFGSSLKLDSYVDKEVSYCMVYEQKHAIQGTIELDAHYITKEKYDSLKRFEVHGGDFIMSCRGTIGRIFQLPLDAPIGIIHPSLMKIRIKNDVYSPIFFRNMLVRVVSNERTNGNCVQMAITAKELGKKPLPVPPIDLQNQFASQIQTIEHQKELIKQSIKEVETLFNSRMDDYFN